MRIANFENNALNWVSISSAGALDMTHVDFSARAARDEMGHIVGTSEPDVIRAVRGAGCARSILRARTDVRSELGNEVCSEDHGHAGNESDSGRSVHVRVGCVCVRTITNARRVGVRLQGKSASTHRHAQTNENNAIEKEQSGTWVRQVDRALEEQLREDKEGLETHEQKKITEDAKMIRGIVHDNNKNKDLSHL